ncbi:MAG TPA: HEPN domain-containing protein [Longimicrobium sp.]|nr:HEPN domain-containing protein [Longimicrobium sp.]
MSDSFEPHIREFVADLDRLSHLLSFFGELREFGARDPQAAQEDEAEFTRVALEMRDKIRSLATDFPILSGTLLLYLAGRFEHFVRMLFETLCDSYAAKCDRFEQLPEKMRKSLVSYSAEVIANPNRYQYDEVAIQVVIKTLADNMAAEGGLGAINSRCLSITEQNMHPGMLKELYNRIGISNIWSEISKQARMKMYFELDKDADVERAARSTLENLMNLRNQIAHPSSSPSFPGPEVVEEYVRFIRVLSEVLIEISRLQSAVFKV